jgi:hypothetical protein
VGPLELYCQVPHVTYPRLSPSNLLKTQICHHTPWCHQSLACKVAHLTILWPQISGLSLSLSLLVIYWSTSQPKRAQVHALYKIPTAMRCVGVILGVPCLFSRSSFVLFLFFYYQAWPPRFRHVLCDPWSSGLGGGAQEKQGTWVSLVNGVSKIRRRVN